MAPAVGAFLARQQKKRLATRKVDEFRNGTLATRYILSRDQNGRPIGADEIAHYSEMRVKFWHTVGTPCRSLLQHILFPRSHGHYPTPRGDWESNAEALFALVQAKVQPFGLPVARSPVTPAVVIAGSMPTHFRVRYHGASFCVLDSMLRNGVVPQTCERKCGNRVLMGPQLFHVHTYQNASHWSQYSDIGLLQSHVEGGCLDVHSARSCFYTNLVVVFDDSNLELYKHSPCTEKVLTPCAYCFEVRTEPELASMGRMISPHIGNFH
jgi:hypothetical protein